MPSAGMPNCANKIMRDAKPPPLDPAAATERTKTKINTDSMPEPEISIPYIFATARQHTLKSMHEGALCIVAPNGTKSE